MNDAGRPFDARAHLARLDADGYTVIPDFLSPADLAAVREALAPFLGTHRGRNNFEGHATERVYTLVARGKVFERIAEDPRVLALCAALLKPGFLLTASQAICIHPGETPQPVHYDDGFYTLPRPRPAVSVSTIVAVDPFTAENGATELIPGSHRWGDDRIQGLYDGLDHDRPTDPRFEHGLVPATMPAGACLFFLGTLLHRGGANRSTAPRLAFSNQYCEPWARQQENFFLGVPVEVARQMSPRLQELLGYGIWPPFMGQVTASHPKKTLRPDYVNAVRAGRADDSRDRTG
jgi:ectoine hydroxylase-related dioxygenase (phytanoyl-CoA dioxygenase family)